jgi:hypothetical protein
VIDMDEMLRSAERYVGTPYVEGSFDCADLTDLVQRELFGRETGLPVHRVRPIGAMGQAREIRKWQGELATRIDEPVTGCAVLMFEPGPTSPIWHVGTVFISGQDVWVLHNSFAMGSALLQRLPDMCRQGMRVDGFYAWN